MSYNGIGLTTAKGSGTSGHIQKNRSSVSTGSTKYNYNSHKHEFKKHQRLNNEKNESKIKKRNDLKGDPNIAQHEKKRMIEVMCFEYREKLEEEAEESTEKLDDDQIKEKVKKYREELLAQTEKGTNGSSEITEQQQDVKNRKFEEAMAYADQRKIERKEARQKRQAKKEKEEDGDSYKSAGTIGGLQQKKKQVVGEELEY